MLKLKLADYPNVYLVDGQYIRDNIYIDFTEGANWLRCSWIPENEIWIGLNDIKEFKFILIHELAETQYALKNDMDLMNDDNYDKCHDIANQAERAARTAPNTVDDTIDQFLKFVPEEVVIWKQ
jgi:hypothetical protein